jgi:hypothetical protein
MTGTLRLRAPRLKLEALTRPPPKKKQAEPCAIPKPSFDARTATPEQWAHGWFWRIAKVFAGLNPGCKEAAE